MNKLNKDRLRQEVIQKLQGGESPSDEEVYHEIDKVILSHSRYVYGSIQEKEILREQVFYSIRGFDLLEKYLQDEDISEIMVVGMEKIFIEKNGQMIRTNDQFASEEEIYRLIDHIVAPTNRMVNESNPIVDARLPDGSRVHIVLPPVSLVGPVITIRKFLKEGMSVDKLISYGSFPKELAAVLQCFVKARYNILVSGATNSGKSSLLNAIADYIPARERIIVIEDSAELQFYSVDNIVRLETRNTNLEGKNEITMQDLIKASLRMRPNRIIVGEVRGAEAVAMLQAFSTGHDGSFSTIHANSCADALSRLGTMMLMGMDIPLRAVQTQIASSIEILIHLGRTGDGQRKLLEISEVCGYDGEYLLNPLFVCNAESGWSLVARNLVSKERKLIEYGQYENYQKAMALFSSAQGSVGRGMPSVDSVENLL